MAIGETIRNSQIWKSIFRHPMPLDRRNRIVVMLTNFFLHLHPVSIKKQGIALSFTWCMGGVTFFLFLVETVTGVLLMFYYRPTLEWAYNDILALRDVTSLGILRELHRFFEQLGLSVRGFGRGEGAIVDVEEVVPLLADREQHGDARERPVGAGIEREHALEHVGEVRRVLAEPLLVEADRALTDALRRFDGELLGEHVAIQLTDLIGLLQIRRDVLELVPERKVFRGGLDRAQCRLQTGIHLAHDALGCPARPSAGRQDIKVAVGSDR